MKIGFANHPRENIYKEIEWGGKNKFDFIDMCLEPDKAEPHLLKTAEIIKILKDYNLGSIGHTAYYIPIGSPLKKLRIAAFDILKEYIDFFAEINCRKMTVHADWANGMFRPEESVKFQIETLNKTIEYAQKNNVIIMYETVTSGNDNKINIKKVLDKLPELRFHADIGHLNLCGRNPLEYVKLFKKKLEHIHLHDNNGQMDLHLPIGTGNINMKELIPNLKKFYDKTITLEIFSKDKDYVLLSKRKLQELWDNA
ncbi:MAG TPA: sugar phosphate isomerase/epimerase [bacterium]|nr:sugar phosphate isomerase/epimerase [bacterium]HPN31084.1 sugar phosphate isomerase/epimerase [bacterium]